MEKLQMSATQNSNFINGEWSNNGQAFDSINPSNINDCLGSFSAATSDDCNLAIQSAKNAFQKWSLSSLEERKKILDFIGSELIAKSPELGEIIAKEEGKPLAEGIGEVYRSGQFFQYFGAEVLRQMGEITSSVRANINVEVTREPLGVIGVITPWNFPIAVAAWKIAPALAYGNCVVLKPSEIVPASAVAFAKIMEKSGLPKGVFNCIQGPGALAGQALSQSKDIDAISFTGSVKTGNAIAQDAIKNMTRVQLEMGSKNALVVLNDADMDTAIQCAINGAFFGTGQKCTASSRLIVEAGIHDQFIEKMIMATKALKVGDALDKSTQIGPVVDARQFNQNKTYIDAAITAGAKMVAGDESMQLANDGFYMRPTLFIDTNNQMKINRDEVFGPIACVIKVKDYAEALEVSNDSDFGLTSGIITQSLRDASHFKRHSSSGCVMVNLPTAGTDYHVPFGGRKASSYGPREQGTYAKEFYSIVKTTYLSS
jgi:aldehyde dehydrogenase (NAD+)